MEVEMNQAISKLVADEDGATAIEYGMLVAMFGMVFMVTWAAIGEGIEGAFDVLAASIYVGP